MKKVLEGTFLFIFFSLYMAYKVFVPDLFDPIFYDICSQSYIDKKIEKFSEKTKNNKTKNLEFQKIKQRISTLEIPPEEIDNFINLSYSYTHLIKNNCPVPDELENNLFNSINSAKKDSIACKKDKFLAKSEKDYEKIKQSKRFYNDFEKRIYSEFTKNIKSKKILTILKEKWKNPNYRKKVIIASIQSLYREEKNCSNIMIPLQGLMKDIVSSSIE